MQNNFEQARGIIEIALDQIEDLGLSVSQYNKLIEDTTDQMIARCDSLESSLDRANY